MRLLIGYVERWNVGTLNDDQPIYTCNFIDLMGLLMHLLIVLALKGGR